MMDSRAAGQRLGLTALRSLEKIHTARILCELTHGPQQPSELEIRLGDITHSVLLRHLAQLTSSGAAIRKRVRELPPRTYYSLKDTGRELLAIAKECQRWEQRWSIYLSTPKRKASALSLLADEHNWAIITILERESLGPVALEKRLPDTSRSTTRRRLSDLMANKILVRTNHGKTHYGLTHAGSELLLLAHDAAAWEAATEFSSPSNH